MMNFEYFTPTKVVFGKGTVDKVGELVKAQGGTKVLIHYGGGSVKRTGLLDRVKAALDAAGVAHVELGGVVPNPRISLVREGLELCRKEGVDFLLPVGGGSVIDSAKAIGYGPACRGGADHRRRRQRDEQLLGHHQRGRLAQAGLQHRLLPAQVRHHGPGADHDPARLPDRLRLRRHPDAHHGAVLQL